MTFDPNRWMWAQACEMLSQAERLRRQFFHPALAGQEESQWEPPVDIVETAGGFRITVALPGVAPEDVDVLLQDGTLLVAGRRPLAAELRQARLIRLEIPHGRFLRRIGLPRGSYLLSGHEFRHGCLTILLERM